jgi:hypothetical protein
MRSDASAGLRDFWSLRLQPQWHTCPQAERQGRSAQEHRSSRAPEGEMQPPPGRMSQPDGTPTASGPDSTLLRDMAESDDPPDWSGVPCAVAPCGLGIRARHQGLTTGGESRQSRTARFLAGTGGHTHWVTRDLKPIRRQRSSRLPFRARVPRSPPVTSFATRRSSRQPRVRQRRSTS